MSELFAEPPPPPLNVYDYAALMALELPPVRYLIEPIIPLGGLTAISGKGNCWKTWFLLNAGLCVAGEKCFLSTFPTMPGTVLVLALEGGINEHRRRIGALSSGLSITSSVPLYTFEGSFTANDSKQKDQLAATIAVLKPSLIAVDHLRAMWAGVEDDSERARNIQIFVKDMQAVHPSTWVMLAHEGKSGPTIRGSSNQEQILDSWLSFERKGGSGIVTHAKARNGPQAPKFEFNFIGPEEVGGAGLTYVGEREDEDDSHGGNSEAELDAAILSEISGAGRRVMRAEIQKRFNADQSRKREHQIDRSLARIEKRKVIKRDPQGREVAFILNGHGPWTP